MLRRLRTPRTCADIACANRHARLLSEAVQSSLVPQPATTMGMADPPAHPQDRPITTVFTQLYSVHQSLLSALFIVALLSMADPTHRASGGLFVPVWASLITLRRRFHLLHDQAYAERVFTRGWLCFVGAAAVAYVVHANTSPTEPRVLSTRGIALYGISSVWVVCFLQVMVFSLTARLAVAATVLISLALTPNPKFTMPLSHEDRLILWSIALCTGSMVVHLFCLTLRRSSGLLKAERELRLATFLRSVTPRSQSGRPVGAMAGHHGFARPHRRARGCPPRSSGGPQCVGCHRAAVTSEPRRTKTHRFSPRRVPTLSRMHARTAGRLAPQPSAQEQGGGGARARRRDPPAGAARGVQLPGRPRRLADADAEGIRAARADAEHDRVVARAYAAAAVARVSPPRTHRLRLRCGTCSRLTPIGPIHACPMPCRPDFLTEQASSSCRSRAARTTRCGRRSTSSRRCARASPRRAWAAPSSRARRARCAPTASGRSAITR